MSPNGFQEHWGRETRLLLLVVVVSIAVLLVLARFRFPAASLNIAVPPPSPLSDLAGRADFADLAEAMSTLLTRVSPRIAIVRLDPVIDPAAARGSARRSTPRGGVAAATPVPEPVPVLAPALRVRPTLALVHLPAGLYPASFSGSTEPIEVVAADTDKSVALIRIAPAAEPRPEPLTGTFVGFEYVGEIEATSHGPTVEPVFIGRADPVGDDRWSATLYAVGEAPGLSAGTFVFSVNGRLIGLVTRDERGALLVPAAVLDAVVNAHAPAGAVAP
jgi:hypothetical protein